jgi:ATP-dependent RNA circularization protein (DNA/RNA ligase family)
VKDSFFKFPSTPHLATLPGIEIRGDKVLTTAERDDFLRHELTIEEKVDGANLGLSFDSDGNLWAQNRGSYLELPGVGQWKKLGEWLTPKTDLLFEHLTDRFILFGEWCYAQHSIFYDQLPDWFLAFDIYDRVSERFLSIEPRDRLLKEMRIFKVPRLAHGRFTYTEVTKFLSESKLTHQPVEGIYLRYDRGPWLERRAKLVRPEFIQAIEKHWSASIIKPNRVQVANDTGLG